jgi:catechol 2,3-dioxygenase-like lactoylglutathione lyase family enzyme
MTVQLDHTIVHARDPAASAAFLAEILGRPEPVVVGHFHGVEVDNGVTLDFMHQGGEIAPQHYAFLVGEEEFDQIFGRIEAGDLPYFADPNRTLPGQINHRGGGRGVYWPDPDGHLLEILTRPSV